MRCTDIKERKKVDTLTAADQMALPEKGTRGIRQPPGARPLLLETGWVKRKYGKENPKKARAKPWMRGRRGSTRYPALARRDALTKGKDWKKAMRNVFPKKFEKGLTVTLKRGIISNVPIEEASRGRAVR